MMRASKIVLLPIKFTRIFFFDKIKFTRIKTKEVFVAKQKSNKFSRNFFAHQRNFTNFRKMRLVKFCNNSMHIKHLINI